MTSPQYGELAPTTAVVAEPTFYGTRTVQEIKQDADGWPKVTIKNVFFDWDGTTEASAPPLHLFAARRPV